MPAKALAPALSLLLILACTAASDAPDAAPLEEMLTDIETAYVGLDLHGASKLAAETAAAYPDSPAAAVWHARLLLATDQYDDGIPAADRAVELAPGDPIAWETQLMAHGWGGIYRGNRERLERALDVAPEAIRRFPNRAILYQLYSAPASSGLNDFGRYVEGLEVLAPELAGTSPIFNYMLARARIDAAESTEDEELLEQRRSELRALLDATSASEDLGIEQLYLLAHGSQVLDENEESEHWLDELESRPGGMVLGTGLRQYLLDMQRFENYEDVPLAIDLLAQQRARIDPAWGVEHGHTYFTRYARIFDMESDALVRGLTAAEPPDADTAAAWAARLAEVIRIVENATTSNLWSRVMAGDALVESGQLPAEAIAIADRGIADLDAGRPGIMYPGTRDSEVERDRETFRAMFLRVRGRARTLLGETDAALADLQAAVEADATADNLRALAQVEAARGDTEAAWSRYAETLAVGFPQWQAQRAESTRAAAIELGTSIGRSEADLDATIAEITPRIEDREREELLGARLDREAPAFELVDLEGTTWSLQRLHGRVVVLNFWATWCGPCRSEMPHYQALLDEYADRDVVFLAISQDRAPAAVTDYQQENDFRFTVLMDDGISNDFHVTGVPTHFILDRAGRLAFASTGFRGPEEYGREMRWRIDALLSETAPN